MNLLTLLIFFEESGLTQRKTAPPVLEERKFFHELGLKVPDKQRIMEIDAYILIVYATVWTIFYWFLSQYIAELSRQKWTTWVESEESDETLVNALQVIVDEIEDRMHDKLQEFQSSFFGSLGAASKKLDDATGQSTIKALTRDNPMMGFVADYMMKRGNLGHLMGQNSPEVGVKEPKTSGKLGLKQWVTSLRTYYQEAKTKETP